MQGLEGRRLESSGETQPHSRLGSAWEGVMGVSGSGYISRLVLMGLADGLVEG